jgi:hypothetical protein
MLFLRSDGSLFIVIGTELFPILLTSQEFVKFVNACTLGKQSFIHFAHNFIRLEAKTTSSAYLITCVCIYAHLEINHVDVLLDAR